MNLTYKESVLCNFLNFVSMKNVLGIREMETYIWYKVRIFLRLASTIGWKYFSIPNPIQNL